MYLYKTINTNKVGIYLKQLVVKQGMHFPN
jgi:hypothetical protein